MKLNRIFTVVIVIALMLALVPAASAQGPSGTWVSGIACQNLDNVNAATIILQFYPEGSGTSVLDYNDTIPAGGSKNYYTPSSPPGLPSTFLGSVLVESSTQLACNVNTQNTGTGTPSNPFRIGTSAGFGDADTGSNMYVPQVMKAFASSGTWNSYIAVQNATSASVNVTVSYKDRYGVAIPAANETAAIPGFSNHVFYQESNANLPSNFLGAATVQADGGIAVVANLYNDGTVSSQSQLLSYNGFASGSTKLLVPRFVRRFYGYNGGMSIQNIGTASTTVQIVFTFLGTSYTYNSPAIAAGAALFLYAPNITELNPVDSLAIGSRTGTAVITSSGQPVIAIVNEDNRGNAADNDGTPVPVERVSQGATYNAFIDGRQTTTTFFPQIVAGANAIYSGGFQVSNTTATAASCTATFNKQPGLTWAFTLPAYGSVSKFAPTIPGIVQPYNGSVTVVCDQAVVGISNLAYIVDTGLVGDSLSSNGGLNR
jgi:hypothetical protein